MSWSFRDVLRAFPEKEEFDFWYLFSGDENTPLQILISGSNVEQSLLEQDADDLNKSSSSVTDAQEILMCSLLMLIFRLTFKLTRWDTYRRKYLGCSCMLDRPHR